MDEIDTIFLRVRDQAAVTSPVIGCLYTGRMLPRYCSPMPRFPEASIGMILDENFQAILARSLAMNPAIHDGAIMIGRSGEGEDYRIVGWSYRLFPPEGNCRTEPNRGSAFNSCLAMSRVESVDRVYLVSKGVAMRFENGMIKTLRQ
jgi:hypothetical protein